MPATLKSSMSPVFPRNRIRLPPFYNPLLFLSKSKPRSHLSQTLTLEMGSQVPGKRPFCPSCSKPARLCLCSRIKHPAIDNSIAITILQHSHEKNHPLNSTRIASLGLKNLFIAPVSDVHFQAQFIIRLMKKERHSNEIFDSGKTQKGIAELGCGTSVPNQSHGTTPFDVSFSWIVDSGKTQKAVDGSGTVFAAESDLGFCKTQKRNCGSAVEKPNISHSSNANGSLGSSWKDPVNTDFDRVLDSAKTQVAVRGGLKNCYGNFHCNLQSSQSHDCKQCFEKIVESPIGKNNANLQSSQKRLEKLVSERIPGSSVEREMVIELNPQTDIVAAVENGGLMNTQNGCREHDEKLDDKEAILNGGGAITHLMPAQNSIKSQDFYQMEGCPTAEEAVITATIAKCGFTCSLTHLCTFENISGNPDFDQLSASPIGKDFISNGFIVKRLQSRQLGGSMEFEEFEITIPPGSALLFPSKKAIGLEDVDFEVKHLIVLDGTWAKAKRMFHENPWLKLLPHLKLDPREMSLYSEVRHQPKAGCLSTIESIVCALKALGDDSVGLDDLLDVFESMVGDQRRCKVERLSKESLA